MHGLSVRAICRATKELADASNKRLTVRIFTSLGLAQVVDENGKILHYDNEPTLLSRRIRKVASEQELEEMVGVSESSDIDSEMDLLLN